MYNCMNSLRYNSEHYMSVKLVLVPLNLVKKKFGFTLRKPTIIILTTLKNTVLRIAHCGCGVFLHVNWLVTYRVTNRLFKKKEKEFLNCSVTIFSLLIYLFAVFSITNLNYFKLKKIFVLYSSHTF